MDHTDSTASRGKSIYQGRYPNTPPRQQAAAISAILGCILCIYPPYLRDEDVSMLLHHQEGTPSTSMGVYLNMSKYPLGSIGRPARLGLIESMSSREIVISRILLPPNLSMQVLPWNSWYHLHMLS